MINVRSDNINTIEFRQSLELSIQKIYGFKNVILHQLDGHDGCVNTVFYMSSRADEGYVRVTTRLDRSLEDLVEEVNFIQYLDANSVSVAVPFTSEDGKTINIIEYMEEKFYYVIFRVATGEQLSQRGYNYIEGVPLCKHHYNCGRILGQIHKASETYIHNGEHKRHHILDYLKDLIETYLPKDMILVRRKFNTLINQLEKIEKNCMDYGMVHGDFGDGNYNIDYSNGKITLFDFDDAGYCWYMYEVACAWSASIGWVMNEENLERRKVLMDEMFSYIVEGYRSIRKLDDNYIKQLPLFLKLVEMERFLDELRYMTYVEGSINFEDEELQEQIYYIENDIQYLGIYEDD